MSTSKKSFLLHIDSLEILDELTNEQCGLLFKACRDFNLGVEINLDPVLSLVFFSFKKQFERDGVKYQAIVDRNKVNGNKGGRPKKKPNPVEPKKPSGLIDNPVEPKKADSVNDSDNDSDSDSKEIVTMSAKANDTLEIFNHWKSVMKKSNNSLLNTKRTKAITARLKEGYTVEQIKLAITGCSMTPHNMGQNDNGKKFDDLELICRNGSNVERFAGNTGSVQKKDINSIGTDFTGPSDWYQGEHKDVQ